jgi:hypothetical protein
VAEGGGLLNRYRGNTPIVGSNPIPSATTVTRAPGSFPAGNPISAMTPRTVTIGGCRGAVGEISIEATIRRSTACRSWRGRRAVPRHLANGRHVPA